MFTYLYSRDLSEPYGFWENLNFILNDAPILLGLLILDLLMITGCVVAFFYLSIMEFILVTLMLYSISAIIYFKIKNKKNE